MKTKKPIVIFFGPPAAGKGTQCALLKDKLGIPHLSTGDMFREIRNEDSALGRQVADILKGAGLVPDEITIAIIEARTAKADCARGYLLDGFPRTVAQAEALDKMLAKRGDKISLVLDLAVSDDELMKRVAGRYQQAVAAGETPREQDKPEIFKERLVVYRKQTVPVLDYYCNATVRGKLYSIDGMAGIDEVTVSILETLDKVGLLPEMQDDEEGGCGHGCSHNHHR